jgi:TRAP-type C4-dicarboxylate transport system permease small subunit
MTDMLSVVRRTIEHAVRWAVIVLMFVMTVLVFLQIVFRYVFNAPLGWSEEMARFAFVWVSFLGASALMQMREHINVTVFLERFPARVQHACVLVANLLGLLCVYFFLVGGLALTSNEWRQLAPATEVRMGWIYLVIPLSAGLMGIWVIIQTLESAVRLVRSTAP